MTHVQINNQAALYLAARQYGKIFELAVQNQIAPSRAAEYIRGEVPCLAEIPSEVAIQKTNPKVEESAAGIPEITEAPAGSREKSESILKDTETEMPAQETVETADTQIIPFPDTEKTEPESVCETAETSSEVQIGPQKESETDVETSAPAPVPSQEGTKEEITGTEEAKNTELPEDPEEIMQKVVEKLENERKVFTDTDSCYVIDGLIEAAKKDITLAKAILLPEKSYEKAFRYFYKKCNKYGVTHDQVTYLDNKIALDLSIQYMLEPERHEEKKPAVPAPKPVTTGRKRGNKKAVTAQTKNVTYEAAGPNKDDSESVRQLTFDDLF